ncbi:MAG: TIR domain-containing protein [Candidatus Lokiarchaeota archaeon]|nr:TIR domain-containing protein [Candidatus Lokiarchaeota archaeon]
MGLKIFFSHVMKDGPLFDIENLAAILEAKPEIDETILCEKADLDHIILFMEQSLKRTDVLVLFCTPNTQKSKYVELEWTATLDKGIPIVPFFADKNDIPTLVSPYEGVEYSPFKTETNGKNLYTIIKKKCSIKSKKSMVKKAQSSDISTLTKKYNMYIRLGNTEVEENNYELAEKYYKKAINVAETELYEYDLLIKAKKLVKKINTYQDIEEQEKNYHGIKLSPAECTAMMELESLVGKKIPNVSRVKYDTFGFAASDSHIKQLGLYPKGLSSLPDTIGSLTSLTELNLGNNNLSSLPGTIKKWLKQLENNGCTILR